MTTAVAFSRSGGEQSLRWPSTPATGCSTQTSKAGHHNGNGRMSTMAGVQARFTQTHPVSMAQTVGPPMAMFPAGVHGVSQQLFYDLRKKRRRILRKILVKNKMANQMMSLHKTLKIHNALWHAHTCFTATPTKGAAW
ncbi:hypothetical protein VPH35_132487 [Triticum aestivum]